MIFAKKRKNLAKMDFSIFYAPHSASLHTGLPYETPTGFFLIILLPFETGQVVCSRLRQVHGCFICIYLYSKICVRTCPIFSALVVM